MRLWLPYVRGGSGTDTFTRTFTDTATRMGHDVIAQEFPHALQYLPLIAGLADAPGDIDGVITNSWNGFAFAQPGVPMATMVQLCVHDDAYREFRTVPQAVFHNTLIRWFEARSFSAAEFVVAVSAATGAAVRKEFPNVEPVVIHNAVDTAFYRPVDHPRPRGAFRLLFIGNLSLRKGVDLLSSVMKLLGPGFVLEYTSGLRDRGELVGENTVALGSLDADGVRAALRRTDALLFPTRLEGLPISVLEAMACGVPIVGSDIPSMKEAVVHEETGLLAPLDAQALAEAVRRLADDPALQSTMREAARIRAEKMFDVERMVESYVKLFAKRS